MEILGKTLLFNLFGISPQLLVAISVATVVRKNAKVSERELGNVNRIRIARARFRSRAFLSGRGGWARFVTESWRRAKYFRYCHDFDQHYSSRIC